MSIKALLFTLTPIMGGRYASSVPRDYVLRFKRILLLIVLAATFGFSSYALLIWEDYIRMSELILSGRAVEKSAEPIRSEITGIGTIQYFVLKIEILDVLKGKSSEKVVNLVSPKTILRPGVVLSIPLTNPELVDIGKERFWFLQRSKEIEGYFSLVHVVTILPSSSLKSLIKSVMAIQRLKEPDQISELIKWLQRDDPSFVRTAVEMLERRRAAAAVKPLASLLTSKEKDIREKVYQAILRINSKEGNLILIQALEENLKTNLDLQAMSLVIYDFQDRTVVPALIRALDHLDPHIKVAAMEKLGDFKIAGVVGRLAANLRSPEFYIRRAACSALGKIGDKKALPYLEDALKTAPEEERREIRFAIQKISGKAR